MVIAKDPKATGNIHYGRSRFTRFRARVYTFLDHPRYQSSYKYYLPAVSYHILLYISICIAGLVLEKPDHSWMREFARIKWGIDDFDVRVYAEVVGQIGSMFLIAEYCLRVWSCVAITKYGGDHRVTDAAKMRAMHWRGRRAYILEEMNLLELVITITTVVAYFFWIPHPHMRFVIFIRVVHWDKSLHAFRFIKMIFFTAFLFFIPAWGIAVIMTALNAVFVYACEAYHRLPNATIAESDIDNLEDAMWYSYVTSMSIGYGDFTPKTGICRSISFSMGYCTNVLFYCVQTAVAAGLAKHTAKEALARNDKKLHHLAAKVIQSWARFHLCRMKTSSSEKLIDAICQRLVRAKQTIEQQRKWSERMLPAKRLIKRARRHGKRSEAVNPAFRKRGMSEPAVVPVPYRLRKVFDVTTSLPGSVDVSSPCKTPREEFGPLVPMLQFLMFGHYKRRFRNTEFRKPADERVREESNTVIATVKQMEKKVDEMASSAHSHLMQSAEMERTVARMEIVATHLEAKTDTANGLVRPNESYSELRKRKATGVENSRRKMIAKRKQTTA